MDEPIAAEAPHYASLPEEFVASVRDAIGHLHDYAHLQRHPLAEALGLSTAHDVAEALRRELYQALEQLDPGPGVSRNAKEWRPYGILLRRYVDGFPVKEIRTQLHISLRQLQREHRRGLEALAGVLW